MSPIEEHWLRTISRELDQRGIMGASIIVRSADAENWRILIAKGGREFEIGFNHRDQFWARETTSGGKKHLVSNDHVRVHSSTRARELGVQLVAAALNDPTFPPRDPPVI